MSRTRSASTSARGSGSAFDGCGSSPADKAFWTIFEILSEKPSKSKTEPGDRSSGKLLARGSKSDLVRRSPLRNCDARTTERSQSIQIVSDTSNRVFATQPESIQGGSL